MRGLLRDHERLFGLLLQVTLGALLFELTATTSFHLLDVLLVLLAAVFCVVFLDRWGFTVRGPLQLARTRFGGLWPLPALLAAYLLCDLAGIFRSPGAEYAGDKYRVVLLMVFLSGCILFWADTVEKLRVLLRALGLAAAFTAAFTLLNYFVRIFPIYYTLRLTLRRDYNVFATTLLLGWLCLAYVRLTSREIRPFWDVLFALDSGVTLTVLYLSSSRRVFLMLPPMLLFWLALFLLRGRNWKPLLRAMAVALGAGAVFFLLTLGMRAAMRDQYTRYGSYGLSGMGGGGGEATAQSRYETVGEADMLAKRRVIWGIAWDAYRSYTPVEKAFGKGFAADIVLYDEVQSPELDREYAHLNGEKGLLSAHCFVLADLLNGGILKAALGILLVLAVFAVCAALLFHSFATAAFYANALLAVVLGSLISNRFGLLYDKFFWLFALLAVLHLRYLSEEKRRLIGK